MTVMNRRNDQVAKSILPMPYYYVNPLLNAVNSAEKKLFRPPSIIEVLVEFNHLYPKLKIIEHIYQVQPALASLIREDWLYVDDEAWHCSTHKHTGYMNFSEKFTHHFGTNYSIDKLGACVTGPTGRT